LQSIKSRGSQACAYFLLLGSTRQQS